MNTLLRSTVAFVLPAVAAGLLVAPPAVASPAPVQEQTVEFPQASPPALVRERFGLTTVEIEYARPSVKGRTVFGELVPFGKIWRTGANSATTISFDTDVTFGDVPVAAGKYALFTIPGEKEWTVILNHGTEQWGSYAYDDAADVARAKVPAQTLAEPVESLTLGLADLRDDSARLTISWDRTRVAIPILSDIAAILVPRIEAVMAAEGDKKPFLQAAMFYYEHDVDMAKARTWIEVAEAQQPDAVWLVYRKGLILAKAGDRPGALSAARKASELAAKIGGELGEEYGRLSAALVADLE